MEKSLKENKNKKREKQ